MIIHSYIKAFEALGFGMFVHFGIYSVYERGEWVKHALSMPADEYESAAKRFCPKEGWARELAACAKEAGCRYITLTARHHDGYSLYDTCGLTDFDAVHTAPGRDLIDEFVTACREQDLLPFFYHTLLDWHHPAYDTDFPAYLEYLRQSVKCLCTNYGEIGGIWFDGMCDKWEADWEEDALYSMIRTYQPRAMIINNTGIGAEGALGHIELDSVTFERGRPVRINTEQAPKYVASEMCQIMNDHWSYAAFDLDYKPTATLIHDLMTSRACGANYLLNVGPRPDGSLRTIDRGMLELLGAFVSHNTEAVYDAIPTDIKAEKEGDLVLRARAREDVLYYCATDLGAPVGTGFASGSSTPHRALLTNLHAKSATWLDTGEAVRATNEADCIRLEMEPLPYGISPTLRIARILLA